MANEFKHKDPCTELTQAEYIGACGDNHVFACQATGDLLYADSSTVLKKLARASSGSQMLQIASCKPAWTATPSLGTTSWANMNHAHGASCTGGTVCANVLAGTTLKACVVNSSLTSVGTLAALQVDYINANASTLTITDSSDTGDLASLAVTTHGATTLTTTDDDAAAAHFTVDADGNITLDSATGIVTIEDGGTEVLRFTESCSGDVTVKLVTNGKDLIFTDNGDAEGFRILDAAAGVNVAGLLTAGSLDIDNVLINGTTIGHTCDTDLMTVGNACLTIKGDVTVGVDDTGHDVKFFGAAAGAYMLYDQSCDQLEIRGASADATTSTGKSLLSTSLTNVNANDVIGSINFQAPAEAGGTDAIAIAAGIRAVAQATFTCAVNATDLIFYTGHSEAATEKFRFTSQGEIGIGGANYGTDGQVLTSTGAGTAPAWEDAAGGSARSVAGDTDNGIITWVTSDNTFASEANLTFDGTTLTLANGSCRQVLVPEGTAGKPSIAFACDVNTGIYGHPCGCDQMWFSVGGTGRAVMLTTGFSVQGTGKLEVQPTGKIHLDGGGNTYIDEVAADKLNFQVGGNAAGRFSLGGFFINETQDCTVGTGSVVFNQGGSDTPIFALKSSDVNHGLTSDECGAIGTETDTFFAIKKNGAAYGGACLMSWTTGNGIYFRNHVGGSGWTSHASNQGASFQFMVYKHDSSNSLNALSADTNLLAIGYVDGCGGARRFLFDKEGTAHADVGTATYDDYCDVELLRGLLATTCDQYKQNYVDKFGEDLMYNQQWYEDNKLIGKCSIHYETRPCGRVEQRAMVNFTGLAMLHHSTIIQLSDRVNARLDGIETQLKALTEGK